MTAKTAFTKDGATKMIDPEDKNQVASVKAAGWQEKPLAKLDIRASATVKKSFDE